MFQNETKVKWLLPLILVGAFNSLLFQNCGAPQMHFEKGPSTTANNSGATNPALPGSGEPPEFTITDPRNPSPDPADKIPPSPNEPSLEKSPGPSSTPSNQNPAASPNPTPVGALPLNTVTTQYAVTVAQWQFSGQGGASPMTTVDISTFAIGSDPITRWQGVGIHLSALEAGNLQVTLGSFSQTLTLTPGWSGQRYDVIVSKINEDSQGNLTATMSIYKNYSGPGGTPGTATSGGGMVQKMIPTDLMPGSYLTSALVDTGPGLFSTSQITLPKLVPIQVTGPAWNQGSVVFYYSQNQ